MFRRIPILIALIILAVIGVITSLASSQYPLNLDDYRTSLPTSSPMITATATNYYPSLEDIRQYQMFLIMTSGPPEAWEAWAITETAYVMTYAGTIPPTRTRPATSTAPSPTPSEYQPCAWMWATVEPEGLNVYLRLAFALTPSLQAVGVNSVRAVAFGENCVTTAGVGGFAAMTTDYEIFMSGENLLDDPNLARAMIGDVIVDILNVLSLPVFSPEQTPGPNPGRITVSFYTDGELNYQFQFRWVDGMNALEARLSGSDMVDALED